MKLIKRIITTNKWPIIKLLVLSLYIVWVVIYFLWGINYVYFGLTEKPTHEQEQLSMQIESLRKELASIPNLVVEREHQFAQAQELLAKEQSRIPDALNINDLVREVIEIAYDCQVKAIPLSTTPPKSITIGQYSYSYWDISMSVEGEFQNIANFIENIDGKYMVTATVASTILDQGKENPDSANITNYTAPVSGRLNFVVYCRN
ncbi:MAG: type 4a pilus biogenesis protein PilO [Candidatus Hodarchaeota archaeon]